jgi:hypothetical protein
MLCLRVHYPGGKCSVSTLIFAEPRFSPKPCLLHHWSALAAAPAVAILLLLSAQQRQTSRQCLQLLQNTDPAASMRNRAALAQFGATLALYKRDYNLSAEKGIKS